MHQARLRIERVSGIEIFTLSDSARLNPLTAELQQAMLGELRRVQRETEVLAVILTAEGRGFCAGADLGAISKPPGDGSTIGQHLGRVMRQTSNVLITAMRQSRVPIISAVNGACAGAGVALALAADVTVMAESAYFYLPFAPRLGLIPDLGSTWFLQHALGRPRALGMALLDERIPASRAVEWGLAWSSVPDAALQKEAMALAQRLARLPSHSVLEIRAAFDQAARNPLEAQMDYEVSRQEELVEMPNFAAGVRAFQEKRRESS